MSEPRAFRLAYDGQPYRGFQRQPDVDTVEDRLFDALRELTVLDSAGSPAGYAAAGRTDAGVSAVAQTVCFEAPSWLTPAALNSELPASIRAWAHACPPSEFHATHHAASRTYTYYLYAPEIEDHRARQALALLAGEHDFHNFTPDDSGTKRVLTTAMERDGSVAILTVRAGGFTRQLVRRLVSAVAAVARGNAQLSWIERLLGPKAVSGPAGVGPAPPEPLVLTDVEYPALSFQVDADAARTAREVFTELHAQRTAATRVAGRLADDIEEATDQ